MSKWEKIAKEAYKAYTIAVDNKSFRGDELLKWEDLGERIQDAWIASVKRAIEYNEEIRLK